MNKENKSICLLTTSFPRWKNDNRSPFLLEYARALQNEGYQVTVIAMHTSGAAKQENLDNIQIVRLKYLPERWETLQETRAGIPAAWKKNKITVVLIVLYIIRMLGFLIKNGNILKARVIAEKLDIQLVQAYVFPFTPTQEFSSVLTPKLPTLFNRLSHHLVRQLMWQGFRSADAIARKKVLNIPAPPFLGPYKSKSTYNMPVLYGFSPSVIPAPSDWNGDTHVTGYWFVDEADNWQPPAALLDFLQSGSAPVYIGFGSMSNRNPEQTADLVIQALELTNQRAVLLSGWGGLQKANIPDSIFMIDSIPHSWLFPRVSAVIHHGGASTTAAGLNAGVPSVIIPFFGDQPFWGQRIADLGVGPKPIPRKRLTVEKLANAIREVVTNENMRQRAAKLGKQIQTENGIKSAVEIFNKLEKREAA